MNTRAEPTGSDGDLARRVGSLSPKARAELREALRKRAPVPGIPRRTGGGPAPLSFSQQRMWFLDQWEPGSPTNNGARAVRLQGDLDIDALRRGLAAVIERHEILRTTYVVEEREPLQVPLDDWSLDMPIVDLTTIDADSREHELARLLREAARRGFDARCRPHDPAHPVSVEPDGARPPPVAPPHRVRRGVGSGVQPRARGALRRVRRGPSAAAAGVADPVRRLRRLAAGAPSGASAREAPGLLARRTRGRTGASTPAGGPCSAPGASPPRPAPVRGVRRRSRRRDNRRSPGARASRSTSPCSPRSTRSSTASPGRTTFSWARPSRGATRASSRD